MTEQTPELPERIGSYQVLQLLGQGGMGAVYEAEETGPVRRRVAIKVVKAGMDSHEVVGRFEAERQALALMNHPGIAKVFHAGTTKSGAPYFTMELIRGRPITEFCDVHRLPIAQRIELFIAVCRAVQHAHQKGVIHRDLKPTNVLVTDQDGAPQPKIIDFGVAKAIGQALTARALVTMSGVALGTAAYMSPEQAEASGVDIDTRSDIYSLGVLLYELLVGELPLQPGDGRVDVFLARLASGDAVVQTPSARLSDGFESGAVARARNTDVGGLRREVRGDIDWIVMKAMHPDRSHRYDSASSLADDLQRHLNNEPILARPPSARYRFGRFVARHRLGVAAAGIVSASIIVGGVLATVGFVHAKRAERVAAAEAAAAQRVTSFLVDLFKVSDPGQSRGNTLTARDILERGANKVSTELTTQPLLQARLMQTLGSVHMLLGAYDQARPLLTEALRIRERELGAHDSLVAETLRSLGDVARNKGEFALADSAYQRALAINEAAFGPGSIQAASSLAGVAALRYAQGRRGEAESLYKRIIPLDETLRSADDPVRARNLRGLAVVYYGQHRYPEAESIFNRVLAMQERTLGKDHYDVAGTLNNLGGLNYQLGRYDEALRYYERARPIYEKSLPPTHTLTINLYNNLGEVYWKLKRYGEAEPMLRRALTAKESSLAPGTPSIAMTLTALAGLLRDEGKYRESEPLYRRALDIREKFAAKNPDEVTETLRDYAEMLKRSGRGAEAAPLTARVAQLTAAK